MINPRLVFERDLTDIMSDFQPREVQVKLADQIAAVMVDRSVGVFEAGTGSGKTLAYLVPAFLFDQRVVISTGTRNLQDQLFLKDLPLLQSLYPEKRVALLKGRANYLCPYRLKAGLKSAAATKQIARRLLDVRVWSSQSATGDITELLDPESEGKLVSLVTSNRENCLGTRCPDYHLCPLYQARQRASDADIVVVNHHLLFADLIRSDEHVNGLLPATGCIIIDEAHSVPEIARQFYGQKLGSAQLAGVIRDIRQELALLGNDDPATAQAVDRMEMRVRILSDHIVKCEEKSFDRWLVSSDESVIHAVDDALADLDLSLQRVAERSEGLRHCTSRIAGLMDRFAMITESSTGTEEEHVHWIDRSATGFTIHLSPLSIADELRAMIDRSNTGWVFTSATLAVDRKFDLFVKELGLGEVRTAVFDSPFNYPELTHGYVPGDLPVPGSILHTAALVEHCRPLIEANAGRTFFLFTSVRAMKDAALLLGDLGRPLFVQGSMSKAELIKRFTEATFSVLLGTQSFWEGVDVRGSSLRLLIIDKLPFPNPSDPLFLAQERALSAAGQSSFTELSLPRTVISLKQGFGRLIRQESDRGLFVLGDSRVRQRDYGQYLLSNLPVTNWSDERDTALAWLADL